MSLLRATLIKASESQALRKQIVSRAITRDLAMRFVAGDTLDDGMAVSEQLAEQGKTVTLDYLGESVSVEQEARTAAKAYLEALGRIRDAGLPAGVSVKPTQMGLDFSHDLCVDLLTEIVAAAEETSEHVTLDMEGIEVTEATIALVEQLQAGGHSEVGCAVQTYLHRTRDDVARLTAAGASLRLCKGAYAEPADVAYQSRVQVDANYARCADDLLQSGVFPRFATHDDRLIAYIKHAARRENRGPDEFEFQMLYGVRPALQDELVAEGYRLRVYVPYGDQWYPYFMRRLAERPANVVFFLRALRGR